MATRQEVLIVKEMIKKGFKDKQIQMITQLKQPYISKVRNGKLQNNTQREPNEDVPFTESQRVRFEALNRILSKPEFFSRETEQDIIYIHVLKFFLIEKEEIMKLYSHMSKGHFNKIWVKRDVDITKFQCELIGVPYSVFLDLIIDFLMKS